MNGKDIRLFGFCVASALALSGIIVGNYKSFFEAETGENAVLWLIGIFDGRAAAFCFALAGVFVSYFTENERFKADLSPLKIKRRKVLGLSALLFLTGTLFANLWHDEILYFLAFFVAVGLIFTAASSKILWAGVLAFTFFFPIINHFGIGYESGWNFLHRDMGLFPNGFSPGRIWNHFLYTGFYSFFPWFTFFLLGLWLGRQDVLNETVRNRIIISAGMIGGIALLASQFIGRYLAEQPIEIQSKWLTVFQTNPIPPMPLFVISAGALAVIIILFCVVLAQKYHHKKRLQFLINFGQMPFSIYLFHIVAGLFLPKWLNLPTTLPIEMMVLYAFVFCVGAMVFTYFWRKKFDFGPFEMLLRKITNL